MFTFQVTIKDGLVYMEAPGLPKGSIAEYNAKNVGSFLQLLACGETKDINEDHTTSTNENNTKNKDDDNTSITKE